MNDRATPEQIRAEMVEATRLTVQSEAVTMYRLLTENLGLKHVPTPAGARGPAR